MVLDLESLKRTKGVYRAVTPIPTVKEDLHQLDFIQQEINSKKKESRPIWIAGIVGIVISLLLPVGLGSIAIGLFVISAVVLIIGLVRRPRGIKIHFGRQRLLLGILDMLDRDSQSASKFNVVLACTSDSDPLKQIETRLDPYRDRWKIDFIRDNWLNLKGELIDGTQFQLSITDLSVSKYGWKRSRSGKSKFKRKNKDKGTEIGLSLQFSRKRYGAIQVLQDEIQGAIQLPQNAQLKRIKASDRNLSFNVRMEKAPPTVLQTPIVQMFLSAYQVLNLAKKLSQQTA